MREQTSVVSVFLHISSISPCLLLRRCRFFHDPLTRSYFVLPNTNKHECTLAHTHTLELPECFHSSHFYFFLFSTSLPILTCIHANSVSLIYSRVGISENKYVYILQLHSFPCSLALSTSASSCSLVHARSPHLRWQKRFFSKHLASANKREYYEMNLKYLLFCIRTNNFFTC